MCNVLFALQSTKITHWQTILPSRVGVISAVLQSVQSHVCTTMYVVVVIPLLNSQAILQWMWCVKQRSLVSLSVLCLSSVIILLLFASPAIVHILSTAFILIYLVLTFPDCSKLRIDVVSSIHQIRLLAPMCLQSGQSNVTLEYVVVCCSRWCNYGHL